METTLLALLLAAFAGAVIGVTVGFFVFAMLVVAKRTDRIVGLFKGHADGRRSRPGRCTP